MDINFIAETVRKNVQGSSFLFRDETVGVPYISMLFYYHMAGSSVFELTDFSCSLENAVFCMKGSGELPDGTACNLEMVFSNDQNGNLQIDMPVQYLAPFPNLSLGCRCFYGKKEWAVTLTGDDTICFSELMTDGLEFLGIPVSAKCFGDAGDIAGLQLRFEIPFEQSTPALCYTLEEDNFSNINRQNYFSLYFETDVQMDLSGIFDGENQVGLGIESFFLEKFGDVYDFTFRGRIKLWRLEIPFTVRYDGQAFLLATVKDEEGSLEIPVINEIGRIVGIEDLHFPESLSALTNFSCESISLSIERDFSNVRSFGVVVSNQNVWQLAQAPDIHITNLVAGFSKNSSGYTVFIGGDLALADWLLTLSAVYHAAGGWIFRCCIKNNADTPLDLSILFQKLCIFLGFPQIPFPLPELIFYGALLSFDLQTKQVSVEMKIGKLNCNFDYQFIPQQTCRLALTADCELSLDLLPVVGTDLHLLDKVMIGDINLISDSGNTILKLNFAGKPLELHLAGAASKAETVPPVKKGMELFWFSLEQHFSIFTIHRLGVGFDGAKITFAFDAELAANAVHLGLEGLAVSAALTGRITLSSDLTGLSIGFSHSCLKIGGGFRHSAVDNVSCYDGVLTIAAKGVSIFAAGSYSEGSFLAYGILRAKIGGPPAFSITGLAVGFGCNKYLLLPDIEKIDTFPLVAAATDPLVTPEQLLAGLRSKAVNLPGQNFLAAGISFESFGMAASFGLLTVSFGEHLEIALLGISEISVPPLTEKDALAKARLALKAALLPETGLFSAEAQLMDDSYILSRNCRLTGGFAFYLWFDGEHQGDFVITLGGYRKSYNKPAHYPDVPRLGFCWNVTPELTFSGELYFALTPSALCAGGKFDAVFQRGALSAWFRAYADFEIGWKPFYYDICIGVSLGASITLDLWLFSATFTLEMMVDLHIWGPEFGGEARVKWWVISFVISFGEPVEEAGVIEWDEFKNTFLQDNIIAISAVEGVIGTVVCNEKEMEVLHADSVKFTAESLIPSTSVMCNRILEDWGDTLGVLPMGEVILVSSLSVEVKEVGEVQNAGKAVNCRFRKIRRSVAKALWAKSKKSQNNGEEELIRDAITGLSFAFHPKEFTLFPPDCLLTLDLLSEYEKIGKFFSASAAFLPEACERDAGFQNFKGAAKRIPAKAGAFMEKMREYGFDFDFLPDLTILAENAESLFDEEFLVCQG